MKKLLHAVFILFATLQTVAQNLVTNNSFEIYSPCPASSSAINNATGWSTSQNSPDYFNACANGITPAFGVPSNICGYQYAATGNAYIGLLCYGSFAGTLIDDLREYGTGTLTQPLTVGTKYYVSLKVARMNMSSHAVDHIGAKFLLTPLSSLPITNNAQVYTTTVVTDTLNWTIIQGSFIADSNYAYISIGNHFTDSNSTVLSMQPVTFGWNAYYFVDDVCVSADSLTCYSPVGINEFSPSEWANLFPNPFSDKLNITIHDHELSEIILYDIASRKLLQQKFTHTVTLNTSQLAKGIYIYEVRNPDSHRGGLVKKGKIVKE
ncbi:MAG TPA: T9SS type A sorting domain-containing protein [Bacteroidia bacterium]|nr:T9SS type A sorting domain-containing protein [Bacteroidia bacterium]